MHKLETEKKNSENRTKLTTIKALSTRLGATGIAQITQSGATRSNEKPISTTHTAPAVPTPPFQTPPPPPRIMMTLIQRQGLPYIYFQRRTRGSLHFTIGRNRENKTGVKKREDKRSAGWRLVAFAIAAQKGV
jgi:hypothetical protein